MSAVLWFCELESPIGPIQLAGDERGLAHVVFARERHPRRGREHWRRDEAPLREAKRQIEAYLAGELRDFDLPLRIEGSAFQQRAWLALRSIPYGETRSYAEQARLIGAPSAVRAVGAANGRNPLPLVLPCHRVIGADGALTGFGGGIEAKRWLLAMEARQATPGVLVLS